MRICDICGTEENELLHHYSSGKGGAIIEDAEIGGMHYDLCSQCSLLVNEFIKKERIKRKYKD